MFFKRQKCEHLVDTPVVRQVEAVLCSCESLHLQDASGDRHGWEVDRSGGLLEAHRGIHRRERDATVPWEEEEEEEEGGGRLA